MASGPAPDHEAERVLLAVADHLHEHCECRVGGATRCQACDLRGQLRGIREELLAWRAEGRRLASRRQDALANAAEHGRKRTPACAECSALSKLVSSLRALDPPSAVEPRRPQ